LKKILKLLKANTYFIDLFVVNLFNNLKKLIKAKYLYSKPPKKKILFFDEEGIGVIKKFFNKNDYEILNVRKENLNISIILKMLLNFKFSFRHYIYFYIKAVDPKIVITFIDNSILFYNYKKLFIKIKFIAIQSGYRTKNHDIFLQLKNIKKSRKKLKADYIFSFGEAVGSEYLKYIESKNIDLGSFKNNLVPISKTFEKKKEVLFISQFRKNEESKPGYWSRERQLLPLVAKFCKTYNLNLSVAGASYVESIEKKYFSKILNEFKFNFIKRKSELSNYKLLDKFRLIVFIDSTLGYEAIARNKKVAVFSSRKTHLSDPGSPFGWPKDINKSGFFYSNRISEKEVFRVLKNIFYCSNNTWNKKTRKVLKGIVNYNFNNKKFFKVINKHI